MKPRNEIIKEAVRDFFGSSRQVNTLPIMKYLTKRNKPALTEEQKDAVWHIKANLADKVYYDSLSDTIKKRISCPVYTG